MIYDNEFRNVAKLQATSMSERGNPWMSVEKRKSSTIFNCQNSCEFIISFSGVEGVVGMDIGQNVRVSFFVQMTTDSNCIFEMSTFFCAHKKLSLHNQANKEEHMMKFYSLFIGVHRACNPLRFRWYPQSYHRHHIANRMLTYVFKQERILHLIIYKDSTLNPIEPNAKLRWLNHVLCTQEIYWTICVESCYLYGNINE